MSLEVEQKFQITDSTNLESKLKELGFSSKGSAMIVDWYFDNDKNYLTTRDCWLRYREKGKAGQWELKKGRGDQGTTVYEELEGEQAYLAAASILEEAALESTEIAKRDQETTLDGFQVPEIPLPKSYGLHPFCRLETKRSSWYTEASDSPYAGLSVDLDSTNTGHTVGEVEIVCDEAEVEIGKKRVQTLIMELTGNDGSDSSTTAVGKLEHFLLNNRPEHYAACVASGVIGKQ
jgi:adenylate cyclase class IV